MDLDMMIMYSIDIHFGTLPHSLKSQAWTLPFLQNLGTEVSPHWGRTTPTWLVGPVFGLPLAHFLLHWRVKWLTLWTPPFCRIWALKWVPIGAEQQEHTPSAAQIGLEFWTWKARTGGSCQSPKLNCVLSKVLRQLQEHLTQPRTSQDIEPPLRRVVRAMKLRKRYKPTMSSQ